MEQSDWIVDCGSSSNFTGNKSLINHYVSIPPFPVTVADGTQCMAIGRGDCTIHFAGHTLTLNPVFWL